MRRRRECSSCGHRFTTYERYERGPLFVRKRDGERQPFDRAKLRGGLARAAHKRPVGEAEIDALVERIEAEAERAGGELPTRRGSARSASRGCARIDRVAYLQFAAVYKQLDVEQVQAELAGLAPEPGPRRPSEIPARCADRRGRFRPARERSCVVTPESRCERREVDVEDRRSTTATTRRGPRDRAAIHHRRACIPSTRSSGRSATR